MEQNEKLQMLRHSMAHVLAKAVTNLYDGVKLTIGPAIDDGFYYDFDMPNKLTPDDFEKIENEMLQIIKKGESFERKEVSKKEALELFKNNEFKSELINELPENEAISIYYLGENWFDLCRGPHVENTFKLQNVGFKISRVSGAYWRGSEKNKMLQRVYVYAFASKKDLSEHIQKVNEALKRDHNKIGRELGFFTTVDYIGQGLPIMLEKGSKVLQTMQRWVEDEEEKRGYILTKTPFMAKSDLYKISGHWFHYKENMFILGDEEKDKEVFALRPMTCPFQFQVYLNKPRSYKDLPMRLNETSTLFRNEASGEMHGLIRLRQFTISEGHIACLPSQLEDEFKNCLDLAVYFLKTLGLDEDITYRFSKWDPNNKEKYIGSAEQWEKTQDRMREILTDLNIEFSEEEGEAAFYGPKLDIQIKNVFGKEDTLITIQIDFQLAEKFGMEYTDSDGTKKFPYIIHRTSIGCYERTLALLIEKYAGALPTWLCPVQVLVANISDASLDYCKEVANKLREAGIKVKEDYRNEKINYKIREASNDKIPYQLIIGEKEMQEKTISYRGRKFTQENGISLEKFIEKVCNQIKNKDRD